MSLTNSIFNRWFRYLGGSFDFSERGFDVSERDHYFNKIHGWPRAKQDILGVEVRLAVSNVSLYGVEGCLALQKKSIPKRKTLKNSGWRLLQASGTRFSSCDRGQPLEQSVSREIR